MTIDAAYTRWADSYDADPNARELHPKRQYLGSQARFVDGKGETTRIQAYVHHVSDFTRAALEAGFQIERPDEWWGADDAQKTPRQLTLLLRKNIASNQGVEPP